MKPIAIQATLMTVGLIRFVDEYFSIKSPGGIIAAVLVIPIIVLTLEVSAGIIVEKLEDRKVETGSFAAGILVYGPPTLVITLVVLMDWSTVGRPYIKLGFISVALGVIQIIAILLLRRRPVLQFIGMFVPMMILLHSVYDFTGLAGIISLLWVNAIGSEFISHNLMMRVIDRHTHFGGPSPSFPGDIGHAFSNFINLLCFSMGDVLKGFVVGSLVAVAAIAIVRWSLSFDAVSAVFGWTRR